MNQKLATTGTTQKLPKEFPNVCPFFSPIILGRSPSILGLSSKVQHLTLITNSTVGMNLCRPKTMAFKN